MAWSAPRVWVASELVTAALMNQEIKDNFNALVAEPFITASASAILTGETVLNFWYDYPRIGTNWQGAPALDITTAEKVAAANTIYYTPICFGKTVTVSEIGIIVSTAQAGADARLGIYTSTAAGVPDALLLDAGAITCAATGIKSVAALSQALTGGVQYHLAVLNELVSVGYRAVANGEMLSPIGLTVNSTDFYNICCYDEARTFGDGFPATATPVYAAVNAPYMVVKFT